MILMIKRTKMILYKKFKINIDKIKKINPNVTELGPSKSSIYSLIASDLIKNEAFIIQR